MIRLIFLCFLFCLCSCATSAKKNLHYKSIPAADKTQARNIIQNHLNFLRMLFEQSQDPYYNVPKWSQQCIEENKIGSLNESGNKLQAISILYLDSMNEVGHCSSGSRNFQAYVVYIYCDKANEVREIKYPLLDQEDPKNKNLCE